MSLDHGGVCRPSPSLQLLVDRILEYLASEEDGCLVIEDYLARASDPVVATAPLPWAEHGDEVYYLISGQQADRSLIESRAADPVHLLGLLTHAEDLSGRGELSDEDLKHLVDRAAMVIVGILDGESYATVAVEGRAA